MIKFVLIFVFASMSFISFAKESTSTKYDWKKDLVDVEYHLSDNYVKDPGLNGTVTYLPVYKSWPEWTKLMRNLVQTSSFLNTDNSFEWSEITEEYSPYQSLQNEFRKFSEYLMSVRTLCGRYPTKEELILLSKSIVHSLKCASEPSIYGKKLFELKHWAEALSDPELRIYQHKTEGKEWFHVVLRLPPLIHYDSNSDYDYAPELHDTYVINVEFPKSQDSQQYPKWDTLLNYLRGCGHEFYLSMLGKDIKDSKGFCYQNGNVVYPFERFFKKSDVYIKKNKTLHFEHLVERPAPHIYFREYYKKKHGDPKLLKSKKEKKK